MAILEEGIEKINIKNFRLEGTDYLFNLECIINNGMDRYKITFYSLHFCSIDDKISIEKKIETVTNATDEKPIVNFIKNILIHIGRNKFTVGAINTAAGKQYYEIERAN